jgi:hypothetical protein
VPGFANLRDDNVTTWYSTMYPRNASRAWDKDEALSSKAIAVHNQAGPACTLALRACSSPVPRAASYIR